MLEKQAVLAGGGTDHRTGLYDAILVKENHAALAGGVGEATRIALAEGEQRACRSRSSARRSTRCAPRWRRGSTACCSTTCRLDELRAAVELNAGRALLEASGGVSLETVRGIAETGVDFISVGAITHSAPALDLSLTLHEL